MLDYWKLTLLFSILVCFIVCSVKKIFNVHFIRKITCKHSYKLLAINTVLLCIHMVFNFLCIFNHYMSLNISRQIFNCLSDKCTNLRNYFYRMRKSIKADKLEMCLSFLDLEIHEIVCGCVFFNIYSENY